MLCLDSQKIYLGSTFWGMGDFKINDQIVVYNTKQTIEINQLKYPLSYRKLPESLITSGYIDEDIPLAETVILPLSLVPTIGSYFNLERYFVALDSADQQISIDVCNFLSNQHKNCTFQIIDRIDAFNNNSEYIFSNMNLILTLGYFTLATIFTGLFGIQMQLLYERKNTIAIYIALGATSFQVWSMPLMENLIVNVNGALIGCVLSIPFISLVNSPYYHINFNPWISIMILIFTGLMTLLTTYMSLSIIFKVDIVNSLKGE